VVTPVAGDEGDRPAAHLTDDHRVAGWPVRRVDLPADRVAEQGVEARAADDGDICDLGDRRLAQAAVAVLVLLDEEPLEDSLPADELPAESVDEEDELAAALSLLLSLLLSLPPSLPDELLGAPESAYSFGVVRLSVR
jgi:hypothetical protein